MKKTCLRKGSVMADPGGVAYFGTGMRRIPLAYGAVWSGGCTPAGATPGMAQDGIITWPPMSVGPELQSPAINEPTDHSRLRVAPPHHPGIPGPRDRAAVPAGGFADGVQPYLFAPVQLGADAGVRSALRGDLPAAGGPDFCPATEPAQALCRAPWRSAGLALPHQNGGGRAGALLRTGD